MRCKSLEFKLPRTRQSSEGHQEDRSRLLPVQEPISFTALCLTISETTLSTPITGLGMKRACQNRGNGRTILAAHTAGPLSEIEPLSSSPTRACVFNCPKRPCLRCQILRPGSPRHHLLAPT